MKIYLASASSLLALSNDLDIVNINVLETFFEEKKVLKIINFGIKNLFLDSGAYSAFTKKLTININAYINFIIKYKSKIFMYANLDVIGDETGSLKNYEIMKSKGLDPVPVFHYGDDIKSLLYYIDQTDYIALGGFVHISKPKKNLWFDDVWSKYLINKDGSAKIKVHGFGMTSVPTIKKYPW